MALILVVEDEADIRDDIEDTLRFGGHQVIGTANGRLGLEAVLNAHPDLILSDINMPEMDGGQFLEAVRGQAPEVANTPFVFLSAYAEREAVIEGKKLGADDYITKPIDHELLLETVNARLRQVKRLDDQKKQELSTLRRSVLETFPHELRTPLNSVIGFAELLVSDGPAGKLQGSALEYASLILESGRRLQDLVERVLDLVAVTTGRMVPKESELAVEALLRGCVQLHASTAERRGLVVGIEVAPSMARVRSDETFLRRAVTELLSNALKFTDKGGRIVIGAEVAADGLPSIYVRDTGEGMSEEAMARLGSLFFQETSGLSRRHEGLGIGLSVARAFIETLGGRIEVQSQLRIGTTARIMLSPESVIA
jgi:two-component system, sensor histidine kinase and response regulator